VCVTVIKVNGYLSNWFVVYPFVSLVCIYLNNIYLYSWLSLLILKYRNGRWENDLSGKKVLGESKKADIFC